MPPPETSGLLRVTISFTQVACTRCGDRRIVTRHCPTCGEAPRPGEFDIKTQRRRRAAQALRQVMLEADKSDPLGQENRPAGSQLAPLLRRLSAVPSTTSTCSAQSTEAETREHMLSKGS